MREIERIADQLKRAFDGEAWHGPSVMTILGDVTAKQASSRPVNSAHNIWELAVHIGAWERACLRRLNGERAQLTDAEDWPSVTDFSEQAWLQTLASLRRGNEELRSAVLLLDDASLDKPVVEGLSTVYVTLHGVIQHDLYHAGQIAILKKALPEV